jgi:murein L,D-transpeptidase YcbB/YkuD
MRTMQIKHLLAGTAVALVLAATAGPASATAESQAAGSAITATEPTKVDGSTATPPAAPETPSAAPVEAVTPPPAAPAAAASAPPTADQAMVERMRDITTGKYDRSFASKKERAAVEAWYATRNFAPIWITDGAANARAKSAIAQLKAADAEGLDVADYPTPDVKASADAAALAEAEYRLTASALAYARHAANGRVHFSRVTGDAFYNLTPVETGDVLAKLADAKDAGAALADYLPQAAGYKALRAKLADARAKKGAPQERISTNGPLLKPSAKEPMEDVRVAQVRARLGVTENPDSSVYDKAVVEAVTKFQKSHGLQPTGNLNTATINAINGPSRDRDADIILANLERWRWLPHDLGRAYVMLNIPDYTLRVVRDGNVVWQTRVVVGKPGKTATPILSETMKYITVNPTWNVPPSIVYNEYLPALQQDPTVLTRMGLKLSQNRDGSIHISQPPGERNALGRIRFNFPNRFLVYQHDTPDKQLFAHDRRAYSHGCMRVQDPARYAEVILSIARPNEGYTQDRIRKMFGTSEIDIQLPNHIPVHITYQTAYVDDAGKLVIRDDIYGRDTRVLAALKGEDRRYADVPMERPKPSYARPAVRLPYGVGESYAANTGPSFFDMLFGGAQPQPPAPVNQRNPRRTFAR